MKKLICAAMAVALLVLLAACGSSGNSQSDFNQTQTPYTTTDQPSISDRTQTSTVTDPTDNSISPDSEADLELQNPDAVSMRNHSFTRVTDFSEGRAWVQYWNE